MIKSGCAEVETKVWCSECARFYGDLEYDGAFRLRLLCPRCGCRATAYIGNNRPPLDKCGTAVQE